MNLYGMSHKGNIRKENQDAYFIEEHRVGVFENISILADGMGGHKGGAIASKLAVDTIYKYIKEATGDVETVIKEGIRKANSEILLQAAEDISLFGMGTTVEVVTFHEGQLYIGHVGDSRVYVMEDGKLTLVTKDHSYVQELVDAGVITEEEAISHPNKNRITRALGVDRHIEIDFIQLNVKHPIIRVLLCSDGLTNMVEIDVIAEVVDRNESLEARCKSLIDKALEQGGTDNITVIILEERSDI